ncbi:MAG TPA: nuclear transport factor 2 family protein [Acidimicrobiales bacterium]|nr:nuclear transport factor 2 family protein [Acidimicrobiales bacterium]
MAAELSGLRRRVDAAEAVLELQALKAHYGELVDQRFSRGRVVAPEQLRHIADEIAELFAEDGVWDGGPGLGRHVGRAAIADQLRRPTLTFSMHLFVKPSLEVDGDRARGRWDLLCPCVRPDGSSWWMGGVENDEYVRINGTWLHQSMTMTTVFMVPVAEGWTKILA